MTEATRDSSGGEGGALRQFISAEASGGIVLMIAAVAALVIANSPLSAGYADLLHSYVGGLSVLHWINDGLMAIFFLLVGLEVKREFLVGQLSSWKDRVLPGAGAVAGMVVPALLFVAVNWSTPANLGGWAVPAATDIAFALGILALLGSRAPTSLKILLTAVAVIDDLLAVVAIALFYTDNLSLLPLAAAAAGIGFLGLINRSGVRALWPYLTVGALIWYAVLLSGVHATLAGVAVAMTVPLGPTTEESPLERLEHAIHPWTSFLIVPIFGFANAGISLAGIGIDDTLSPLPLGVFAGLFLGKQLGIFGTMWALIRLGAARMPAGVSWLQLYGLTLLCGIGFTMSLFIGALAFADDQIAIDALKLGIFAGSVLSGICGSLVLLFSSARKEA